MLMASRSVRCKTSRVAGPLGTLPNSTEEEVGGVCAAQTGTTSHKDAQTKNNRKKETPGWLPVPAMNRFAVFVGIPAPPGANVAPHCNNPGVALKTLRIA